MSSFLLAVQLQRLHKRLLLLHAGCLHRHRDLLIARSTTANCNSSILLMPVRTAHLICQAGLHSCLQLARLVRDPVQVCGCLLHLLEDLGLHVPQSLQALAHALQLAVLPLQHRVDHCQRRIGLTRTLIESIHHVLCVGLEILVLDEEAHAAVAWTQSVAVHSMSEQEDAVLTEALREKGMSALIRQTS